MEMHHKNFQAVFPPRPFNQVMNLVLNLWVVNFCKGSIGIGSMLVVLNLKVAMIHVPYGVYYNDCERNILVYINKVCIFTLSFHNCYLTYRKMGVGVVMLIE